MEMDAGRMHDVYVSPILSKLTTETAMRMRIEEAFLFLKVNSQENNMTRP
jgi:hypothetical protein